jgi:uncharacterized protein YbjT (DUF2867 family)
MRTILVTGATGNVGMEVIKALSDSSHSLRVVAGVRAIEKDAKKLSHYPVHFTTFDFTDTSTYKPALSGCDVLFLLRPPQISAVAKFFKLLVDTAKEAGVQHIVFLSVQGAGDNNFIPHHKIEALIKESGISYTFLRPAYFMQNFTTTLREDLIKRKQVFLPAGTARFTLIDVRDIGKVAARVLQDPEAHGNKAYDLTNDEKLSFGEMADIISGVTTQPIRFVSPNLIRFFVQKRKEGMPPVFILVMIMLHYLPRFRKEPVLSNWVEVLTGRPPITFEQFVKDHTHLLS